MSLRRRSVLANDVRVPEIARGEVVLVGRYRHQTPKAAILNPDDLAMLEDAHDLLAQLDVLAELPVDELTLQTLAAEDRPDPESITNPDQIAKILNL